MPSCDVPIRASVGFEQARPDFADGGKRGHGVPQRVQRDLADDRDRGDMQQLADAEAAQSAGGCWISVPALKSCMDKSVGLGAGLKMFPANVKRSMIAAQDGFCSVGQLRKSTEIRVGQMQGGALYGAAAVAAAAAVGDGWQISSGYVQYLRPVDAARVSLRSRMIRRGRRAAFSDVLVAAEGRDALIGHCTHRPR
jgi:hypothetical protein